MPIKNLNLDIEFASKGLPRIGKLFKGSPKRKRKNAQGKEYEIFGEDLTYFRVEFEDEYRSYAQDFITLYGDKPDSLPVMVNGDTVQDAFDYWNEAYAPSGTAQDKGAIVLQKRCDGDLIHLWYNERTGYHEKRPKPCESAVCGCKPTGRMNLILPEFSMQTGVLGYFTVQTHSERDIRVMNARLVSAQVLFGGLRGVQFLLYRTPQKLNVPMMAADGKTRTGKKSSVTKYMLEMRVEPSFVQAHLLPALNSHRAELPGQIPGKLDSGLPTTDQARETLGTGGSRRIGNGNGHSPKPALPATTDPAVEPEPAVDFGADLSIEENAKRWQATWEDKGVTRPDLLAALGMPGITLWKDGSVKADAKVEAFIKQMMGESEVEDAATDAEPVLENG